MRRRESSNGNSGTLERVPPELSRVGDAFAPNQRQLIATALAEVLIRSSGRFSVSFAPGLRLETIPMSTTVGERRSATATDEPPGAGAIPRMT